MKTHTLQFYCLCVEKFALWLEICIKVKHSLHFTLKHQQFNNTHTHTHTHTSDDREADLRVTTSLSFLWKIHMVQLSGSNCWGKLGLLSSPSMFLTSTTVHPAVCDGSKQTCTVRYNGLWHQHLSHHSHQLGDYFP